MNKIIQVIDKIANNTLNVKKFDDNNFIVIDGDYNGLKIFNNHVIRYYEPKKGYKICVPSSYYVYRGEDDFDGGIATIKKVIYSKDLNSDHINYVNVEIEERPGFQYNWKKLLIDLEKNYKAYGNNIACKNPDLSPEFNNDNADWK